MSSTRIFVSTIIPTVGRSTLSRAVTSVLDQQLDTAAIEVIVVNDSAKPLPKADWQDSPRVRIIETRQRERSVARNTGAAIAHGGYLHFLDDDDVIVPGALNAFWKLATSSGNPDWMYGNWQTVDNKGALVDEFRPDLTGNIFAPVVAGEALPIQASLIRADHFFAVGEYDPQMSECEDRDLGRRMALRGTIAHTNTVVVRIRIGEETSTTKWERLAESDRWGREKALDALNAFDRLRKSARNGYWRGRVSRAYFASAVWNVRRGRLSHAASRTVLGVAIAGWRPLVPGFWKGLNEKIK